MVVFGLIVFGLIVLDLVLLGLVLLGLVLLSLVTLQGTWYNIYRKVVTSNTFHFEALAGLFRFLMKGIFDAYVM